MINKDYIDFLFVNLQDILYEWRDGKGNFWDDYIDTDLLKPSYRPWENDLEGIINDCEILIEFVDRNSLNSYQINIFQSMINYLLLLIDSQLFEANRANIRNMLNINN